MQQQFVGTLVVTLAVFCTGAPSAQAQQGPTTDHFWYIGGDLGYARDKFSTDRPGWPGVSSNNATMGLRGGYQFSRYFSVESTLSSLADR